MKKVITKEMLTQYYELDVGNCLMTKEDFCEHIAEILNKPVESKISITKEITEYYEERDIDIFAQETADNQICNICASDFDLNSEGGISGNLGILPIALCPTCLSGTMDLMKQLDTNAYPKQSLVRDEIGNFILWAFHQNNDEATGTAKSLYNGIDTFMDEVYEEDE